MQHSYTPVWMAQASIARPANSLPLSSVMLSGAAPRSMIARVSAATTFGPFIHGTIRLQPDAFACELIDHRQDPDRAAVGELVADEIRRPAMVRSTCLRLRNSLAAGNFLTLHTANLQVLFVIEPGGWPGKSSGAWTRAMQLNVLRLSGNLGKRRWNLSPLRRLQGLAGHSAAIGVDSYGANCSFGDPNERAHPVANSSEGEYLRFCCEVPPR